MDFRCKACNEPYELKASYRPIGRRVLDGEYRTLVNAIHSQNNPNLFLLAYDKDRMLVSSLSAVPRVAVSRLAVEPRAPLGIRAERAGWQGCYLNLDALPASAIVPIVVSGVPRTRDRVLVDWRRFDFIVNATGANREWLPDVMNCVRRLEVEEFRLADVYDFEAELALLHPKNKHVKPKIRQQIQLLVKNGLVTRIRPGLYRKTLRV